MKIYLENSEEEFKNLRKSKDKNINDQMLTLDRHVMCSIKICDLMLSNGSAL